MSTSEQLLQFGLECHRNGDLTGAEASYRQILALDPRHADAWQLLGVVAHQRGQNHDAVQAFQTAIGLAPERAHFHTNLAEAYRALGEFAQAAESCRKALDIAPRDPAAYNNLALALMGQHDIEECIQACRDGLQCKPDSLELWNNLGEAYRTVERNSDAEQCFRRALEIDPISTASLLNLGNTLRAQHRLDEAQACLLEALRLRPDYAKAHCNLCTLFLDQQRLELAAWHAVEALRLNPNLPAALSNMSTVLQLQGRVTEGLEYARSAIRLAPDLAEGHNGLASGLQKLGCAREAVDAYETALRTQEGAKRADIYSNLLFAMQYLPEVTPQALLAAHRTWDTQHAARWRAGQSSSCRRPPRDGPLRVGLVSPDLGCHPVGSFVESWLQHVDRARLEIICYSDRRIADDATIRLRAAAADWRDTAGKSDDELADTVRSDRVDILCDLAGHTRSNRLLVFARKPAPVQITWMGYVGTTGLTAMDYLIADRYLIPPGEEEHYSERVLRLPDGWLCYAPILDADEPVVPPCLAREQITFGCFNNSLKLTPNVIQAWSEIMRRVPHSRLLLKFKWFDEAGTREHFIRQFMQHGIDAGRLDLRGWSSQREHLRCYGEIDLALDTFPYTGGVTTCEALWMGVPVVSLAGRTFASRQSYSHLMNVSLADAVAHDVDEYVNRAVNWATDRQRLASVRTALREQMRMSPLCDGQQFAEALTSLFERACTGDAS